MKSRATRQESADREKERLDRAREERREERIKERERERENKQARRRDRRRRSRSRSHSPSRSSRHRRSRSRSRSRRDRSRSRDRKSRYSDRENRDRENRTKIEEITKETGIKVPDFLAGSSATKRNYLETQAKRKMLWGNKKTENAGELTEQQKLWANLNVGDERKTNKFQKLMGASKFKDMVKDDNVAKQNANALLNKQTEMFNAFNDQYNASRLQTHSTRGRGFGN